MADNSGISKECWIVVYHGSDVQESVYLPVYPDEVSDAQSAIWSSTQIIGRSSPLAAYTGTDARKISFSISLHREMSPLRYKYENGIAVDIVDKDGSSTGQIEKILVLLRRALYPKYQTIGLIPPRIRVVLGNLAVDGVLENVTFTWKKPIVMGKYMVCDVNLQITGYPSSVKSSENISSSTNPDGIDTTSI